MFLYLYRYRYMIAILFFFMAALVGYRFALERDNLARNGLIVPMQVVAVTGPKFKYHDTIYFMENTKYGPHYQVYEIVYRKYLPGDTFTMAPEQTADKYFLSVYFFAFAGLGTFTIFIYRALTAGSRRRKELEVLMTAARKKKRNAR